MKSSARLTIFFLLLCILCSCEPWCKKPESKTDRTLVIFMDANNDLSWYAHNNIDSLLLAASESNFGNGRLMLYYNKGRSRNLYEIKPFQDDAKKRRGDTILIESYQFDNALSENAIYTVLNDALRTAPADEYGLILWSHSSGWLPDSFDIKEYGFRSAKEPDMPITKSFGMDGNHHIEYKHLAKVLERFDWNFILIDACFGACAESLYDMRHSADYLIVSPIEIMGEGFPYKKIVGPVFERKPIAEICQNLCKIYVDFYRYEYAFGEGLNRVYYPYGAISLIDMSEMDSLAKATKEVMKLYKNCSVELTQVQALENRNRHLFYDLRHYLELLAADETAPALVNFRRQFEQTVLFHDHTYALYSTLNGVSTVPLNHCYGMSTYIPTYNVSTYFDQCNEAYFDNEWTKIIYSEK